MEQRNGRIDRKLQPNPDVYCHYFFYKQRPEDRILRVLSSSSVSLTTTTKPKPRSLAEKLWNLRIFEDEEGAINKSAADFNHDILVVSQFTLYGDTVKGRRPSFINAARPEAAEPLVDAVVEALRKIST